MIGLNFAVGNIKQTPGIISDIYANIPSPSPSVVANGTIFIATDTGLMYSADTTTVTWVPIAGSSNLGIDDVLSYNDNLLTNRMIKLQSFDFQIGSLTFSVGLKFIHATFLDPTNKVLLGFSNMYLKFDDSESLQCIFSSGVDGMDIYKPYDPTGRAAFGCIQNKAYIEFISNNKQIVLNMENFLLKDVTGNLISTTAGGGSGKHLKININGVNYKINLLNP